MARFLKDRSKKIGAAPGTPVFIGKQRLKETSIHLIDYTNKAISEKHFENETALEGLKDSGTVSWINVCGLHNEELITEIGGHFDLHNLLIEDVLNTGQRPTFTDYDDYFFIAVKMLKYDKVRDYVDSEQLTFVVGKNYILTFQEELGDVFDPIRNRLRKEGAKIRERGADYLCYVMLDTVIDHYIHIIERFGDKIEHLESQILGSDASSDTILKITDYKREMSYLRKVIRPAREACIHFSKSDSALIHKRTQPFLKDLEGLASLTAESVETYSDILSDQLNIYQTTVSNRLNDVMKVLTIFSVVFIPLTFIAGIYGTNFEYLPELQYHYAYPIFWGVMITVALGMLYYFKRKKWI
ncbi:magnesium and cobalt transport protein CorA [Roseivirga sp. 4D4]|uniref:magnesium/cobalt transporter CorA n=1 Tax=Roseivirga sp. 4D4 TaxID=1889784 RepID=UPI000852ED90|nr:magnesium/cobalt transporter CorA [Roseivirga sp. 4D4]OEK02933.1 magnesium and cobalt transport protein CorA [Roseivirga sp. 4D4]